MSPSQGQISTFEQDSRLARAGGEVSYSTKVATSDITSSLHMCISSSFQRSTGCLVAHWLTAQSTASKKHKHRTLKCSIMLHSVKEEFPGRRDFEFVKSGNTTCWWGMALVSTAQPETAEGRGLWEATLRDPNSCPTISS